MKTIINEIPSHKEFYKGEKGLEVGYPWFTLGAIYSLERILGRRKTLSVLELGSGGSTVFFSKRAKSVIALEHDPKWYRKLKGVLSKDSNVTLVSDTEDNLLKYVNDRPNWDGFFDIVSVDSGPDYVSRAKFLKASAIKVKKDGWLVLDNYANFDRDFDYTGFDVFTFDMFQYSGRGTRICKKLY